MARTSAVAEFGAFTLMFGGYVLLRAIVRALVGVPLQFPQMNPGRGERNPEFGPAIVSSLAMGLVGTLLFVAVAVTAHGDMRMMAAVLALSMPPLMLQDTIRYMAISQRRAGLAAGSDAIWLAVQVAGFLAFRDAGPTVPVAVWGLGGVAGCLMLGGTSGNHPFKDGASAGSVASRRLAPSPFLCRRGAVEHGPRTGFLFLLAALAGLSVVAGVRAGFAVLGLASAVLAGLSPAITTEVSRAKEDHVGNAWILTFFVAAGAVSSTAVAGGALVLSESAGQALLGATWTSAKPTLVPLAVALALFTPVSAMVILS